MRKTDKEKVYDDRQQKTTGEKKKLDEWGKKTRINRTIKSILLRLKTSCWQRTTKIYDEMIACVRVSFFSASQDSCF